MSVRHGTKLGKVLSLALAASVAQAQPGQPAVPGLSDTAVIIIGTVLSLLVIYAIVAAHLRKEG